MSGLFTLTTGTLTLGTFTLTAGTFSSTNTNARTIAFGTGNITLTSGSTNMWNTDISTNLTVTGTPVVNSTYSGSTGTRNFFVGNAAPPSEANSISFNVSAGSDTVVMYGAGLRDINFTGFTGTWSATGGTKTLYGSLTLSTGMTLAAGIGTITFAATSGTQTITSNGRTIDGAVTFNGVGGTFQLQDNLTMGSTRTATLTNGTLDLNGKTFSCGLFSSSNSNTRTLVFGTGNITTTGSGTVWNTATITNFTVTGTPVVNVSNNSATATSVIPGSWPESTAPSFNFTTGTYTLTFPATTASTVKNVDFTGFAGTWSSTATDTVYGNLTISTGMTVGGGSNAVTFGATSGTKAITTNGKTLDFPLTFNGVGGTFSFADALTQGSTRAFTITNGTVKMKDGTTNTVGSFATGGGTTQRFLQSTVAGSQATLTAPSGTFAATYLTIQDIVATGGATWNAYTTSGNVNAGNNVNWNFLGPARGLSYATGLYAGYGGLSSNSGLDSNFPGLGG